MKLIILLVLLFVSFVLLFWEIINENNDLKTYQISVIASGKSDESLMILKEGAEQAAADLNANIRFIFLSQDQDSEEQIDLIKRESRNNVDAILVSPIENEEVVKVIDEVNKKVPIVIIQSSLKVKHEICRVTCDEYFLGQQLATEALKTIKDEKGLLIVKSDLTTTASEERYGGIIDVINEGKKEYFRYELKDYNKENEYESIDKLVESEKIGAIICLDVKSSEYIGEYKKNIVDINKKQELEIYSVGSTNKIISFLEEDIINGTAIQNEFNIGYLAIENAINANTKKKDKEKKIKSTIITSENMYLDENEKILFQFVR